MIGVCRLCGQPRKLIKAHIIPEAFFRPLRTDREPPLLVSSLPGSFPARVPIGVYDQTILCKDCERSFEQPDSYGASVLLQNFSMYFSPVQRTGRIASYESSSVDQPLLLRFLLLVLWRASVSTHRFYQRVSLGPYEAAAKSFVRDPAASPPPEFGAILSRWIGPQPTATATLMDPFREHWNGVNAYRFYFGETVAYIRTSKFPFPSPLHEHALLTSPLAHIMVRDVSKSNDFEAVLQTARRSHAKTLAARVRTRRS